VLAVADVQYGSGRSIQVQVKQAGFFPSQVEHQVTARLVTRSGNQPDAADIGESASRRLGIQLGRQQRRQVIGLHLARHAGAIGFGADKTSLCDDGHGNAFLDFKLGDGTRPERGLLPFDPAPGDERWPPGTVNLVVRQLPAVIRPGVEAVGKGQLVRNPGNRTA